jgi:hypothetical protein
MRRRKRRQERRRPQNIAHRIELDDEQMLVQRLVSIACAESSRPLVPDARPIAEKEFTIPRDMSGTNRRHLFCH